MTEECARRDPERKPHASEAAHVPSRDGASRAARRRYRAGIALGLLSATAFGSGAVAAKLAYDSGLNAITLIAGRLTIGSILLWAIVYAIGAPRAIARDTRRRLVVVVGPTFALQGVFIFESVARISVTTMSFLLYLYPALVAIVSALLFGERLGRAKSGALGLSLAGLLLFVGVPSGDVRSFGGVLALAAAVDTTVYLLLLRRIGSEVHPLVSSASVLSGAAVVVVVGGLVTGELHVPASLAAWGWVGLHAALVGTAVCAIVAAVPRVGPTRAAIALTWEPIATALLAALLLAERPTLVQVAGGALVVGAAVLLAMLGPEHGDGENEEEDEGADDAAHAVTVAPSAELPELAETGRE